MSLIYPTSTMRCDSRFYLSTLNQDISSFWELTVATKIEDSFSDLFKVFWTKYSWMYEYDSSNSISGFTVLCGELMHTYAYQIDSYYCNVTIKGTYRYSQRQRGRKYYLMFQGLDHIQKFLLVFFPTNWIIQTYKNLNFQIK